MKRVGSDRPAVPVHLVAPVRQQPDLPAGAFGPVELLQSVTCVGSFTSHPIDPELDPVLRSICWDEDARDSSAERGGQFGAPRRGRAEVR